jgi:hypothetical protein
MDDIQKLAGQSVDEKQNRRISDANRRIEDDQLAKRLRRYMVCTCLRMTVSHDVEMSDVADQEPYATRSSAG